MPEYLPKSFLSGVWGSSAHFFFFLISVVFSKGLCGDVAPTPSAPCVLEVEVLKSQDLQEGKYYRRISLPALHFLSTVIEIYIIHRGKFHAPSLGFLSGIICNKAQYVYVSLHRITALGI